MPWYLQIFLPGVLGTNWFLSNTLASHDAIRTRPAHPVRKLHGKPVVGYPYILSCIEVQFSGTDEKEGLGETILLFVLSNDNTRR